MVCYNWSPCPFNGPGLACPALCDKGPAPVPAPPLSYSDSPHKKISSPQNPPHIYWHSKIWRQVEWTSEGLHLLRILSSIYIHYNYISTSRTHTTIQSLIGAYDRLVAFSHYILPGRKDQERIQSDPSFLSSSWPVFEWHIIQLCLPTLTNTQNSPSASAKEEFVCIFDPNCPPKQEVRREMPREVRLRGDGGGGVRGWICAAFYLNLRHSRRSESSLSSHWTLSSYWDPRTYPASTCF